MKFYDLGDNDYDMASPYRLHIPERGLELSYGKPGAMVFVTTNGYQDDYGREVAGRCVFGTDNERAHADLKKKLGQGERITMRGVLWPEYNVMTVWETFSNMSEFRELMKVVAGGLRDELELNPEDVLLYLGYSHPARGEERNYDMYNVELSVGEACVVGGRGDVNDCFYALFLKDKATRKDNGDIASNGMRNRDIWRHYEVVGENKTGNKTIYTKMGKNMGKKKITLNEAQLKRIITEAVMNAIQDQTPQGDGNPFSKIGTGMPKPAESFKNMYTRFLDRFNTAKETVDQLFSSNPDLVNRFITSKDYRNLVTRLIKSKQETIKVMSSVANKNKVNEGFYRREGTPNPKGITGLTPKSPTELLQGAKKGFETAKQYDKVIAQLNVMAGAYTSLAAYANRLMQGGHMAYQEVAEMLGHAYDMVYKYFTGLRSSGAQGTQPKQDPKQRPEPTVNPKDLITV